ncbi:MAG: hypothetical protein ACRDL8_09420 [Solirubrobacteraceae bacterium]
MIDHGEDLQPLRLQQGEQALERLRHRTDRDSGGDPFGDLRESRRVGHDISTWAQ